MKKICAALAFALTLAACAEETPNTTVAYDRTLPPKIVLDVQAINLADRSGLQPLSSPYNNNHFSPTIVEAIKQWSGDRLQAAGQNGQAIIIIKDASLISQQMPVKPGVDGWFTRQQGSKYIGRAEVSIEANGREGFAMADAVATRSVTLPENPTAVEKQNAYFSLLNGLMKDLGQNLEAGINAHMNGFLVNAPVYGGNASSMGMTTLPANDIISPVVIQSPPPPPSVPIMPMSMAQSSVLQAPVTADQVSPPTMTISQSPQAMPAQQMPQMMQAAAQQTMQPQAPVFGATAIPAASAQSSFTMVNDAQQPPQQIAPASVAMPPLQPISIADQSSVAQPYGYNQPGMSQVVPMQLPQVAQAPLPQPMPQQFQQPVPQQVQQPAQTVTIPLSGRAASPQAYSGYGQQVYAPQAYANQPPVYAPPAQSAYAQQGYAPAYAPAPQGYAQQIYGQPASAQ